MLIVKDKYLLNEYGSVPVKLLNKCIINDKTMINRYELLSNYYDSQHKILNRTLSSEKLPNNKLIANHAEYIMNMATVHIFGCPVNYSGN